MSHIYNTQDQIFEDDPSTEGAMFVPVILGSDKTTVSVGTGNNEYYPLYVSIGNIHNATRRARRNGLMLLGFLTIPKGMLLFVTSHLLILNVEIVDKEYKGDVRFHKFSRQLIHSALSQILQPLLPGMMKPRIVRCPDRHYRKAIFGLGPYIADYPEQCLIACVVQGWCPKYVFFCVMSYLCITDGSVQMYHPIIWLEQQHRGSADGSTVSETYHSSS